MKEKFSSPTTLRLPRETREKLKATSQKFKIPHSALIRMAIEEKLCVWIKDGQIVLRASGQ